MNQNASDSEKVSLPPNPPLSGSVVAEFSDADMAALLKRALWITLALGVAITVILWPAMGWQTAALFGVGALMSAASIYEWGRLIRFVTARMDGLGSARRSGLGAARVVTLFLLRLILFGGVIYVSLKCFQGSPIALLCGLGLAVAGLLWEAVRVLRG